MLRRAMMAQAASGGGGSDPYWSSVVALLNMAGVSGSTVFYDDAAGVNWTNAGSSSVLVSNSLGYNTALYTFGGCHLSRSYVPTDFDWWTSDYTIEAWIHASTFGSWSYNVDGQDHPALIGNMDPNSGTNYWSFGPLNDGRIRFYYYNGSAIYSVTSTSIVSTGALQHVAMSKDSSGCRLAINGAVEPPIAVSGTPRSSAGVNLVIGQSNSATISGHVRCLRITKGVARYTSNFTPPTPPLPTS